VFNIITSELLFLERLLVDRQNADEKNSGIMENGSESFVRKVVNTGFTTSCVNFNCEYSVWKSRDSPIGIATRLRAGRSGF
jgi:hypothetical protein